MVSKPGPPYFNPKDTSSVTLYEDIGKRADRPFMILATFAETALGDLISKIVFTSTLKDQFDHARLIVRYNDFRPYSRDIISLAPNIDHADPVHGEMPQWMRRFVRDLRLWRPLSGAITRSRQQHRSFYDLVIVDAMANARTVTAFPQATPMRIPPDREAELAEQLVAHGVEPDRPFAVLHHRDGTYALKSRNPVRNGDPDSYRYAMDHTIDNLGCQVVRIGHPEMTQFAEREGFVDLSRLKNGFMLQAFAVSRARFMLACASGPAVLGWSFSVPTAILDCAETSPGWGTADKVVLTHEVTTPDGETLRNQALADAGLLDVRLLSRLVREGGRYTIRKNSPQEVAAVADHLHARSADTTGWRIPSALPEQPRPNAITWPPNTQRKVDYIDV